MLNRTVKAALFLSAAWLSQASASAGELSLFAGPGFQGREVTLRAETRDFNDIGFNDRASSMIVRSGRWEVCIDSDFRKECRIFEPGEYRNLERFTNAISSAREVGGGRGRDDDRGEGRGRGRGGEQQAAVLLFDGSDLRGRSLALNGDAANLSDQGFNDRVQSMVIQSGNWEFCVHYNFGGECRVFGPGEYRTLDRTFNRAITSARLVGQEGRGRGRRDDNQRREGVELFAGQGFGGERMMVREEVRNLVPLNFNDRAGSLIVYSGEWEFCQHSDFRGQCMTYGPGRYDRLGSLNNAISSIRRVR
jgi:hypothetical protein